MFAGSVADVLNFQVPAYMITTGKLGVMWATPDGTVHHRDNMADVTVPKRAVVFEFENGNHFNSLVHAPPTAAWPARAPPPEMPPAKPPVPQASPSFDRQIGVDLAGLMKPTPPPATARALAKTPAKSLRRDLHFDRLLSKEMIDAAEAANASPTLLNRAKAKLLEQNGAVQTTTKGTVAAAIDGAADDAEEPPAKKPKVDCLYSGSSPGQMEKHSAKVLSSSSMRRIDLPDGVLPVRGGEPTMQNAVYRTQPVNSTTLQQQYEQLREKHDGMLEALLAGESVSREGVRHDLPSLKSLRENAPRDSKHPGWRFALMRACEALLQNDGQPIEMGRLVQLCEQERRNFSVSLYNAAYADGASIQLLRYTDIFIPLTVTNNHARSTRRIRALIRDSLSLLTFPIRSKRTSTAYCMQSDAYAAVVPDLTSMGDADASVMITQFYSDYSRAFPDADKRQLTAEEYRGLADTQTSEARASGDYLLVTSSTRAELERIGITKRRARVVLALGTAARSQVAERHQAAAAAVAAKSIGTTGLGVKITKRIQDFGMVFEALGFHRPSSTIIHHHHHHP